MNDTEHFKMFTNPQRAAIAICHLKSYISAPLEEQRFCTLTYLATEFPSFSWHKNITSQIDSLLEKAKSHQDIKFANATIEVFSKILELQSFNGTKSDKYIQDEKLIDVCLDLKALRIDCEWSVTSNGSILWNWANLTYKFDESTSYKISVNMSFENQSNPFNLFKVFNERFLNFYFYLFVT